MIRLGIIGTGRIAKRFVPEAFAVEGAEITAVYNPHDGSAERFIQGIWTSASVPAAVSKIDDLWTQVDAVYIASPHETHYDYIIAALDQGKQVLCEKPMVLSGAEARECFRKASDGKLVLMEGIKTAYCPGYRKLIRVALSGVIGDIKYIESCFTKLENPERRELIDIEHGGSFTELGSYVMLPFFDLYGENHADVYFSSVDQENGLDLFTKADLNYHGRLAQGKCGLGVKAEGSLMICGTKGYIKVDAPWWKTGHFEIHFEDPGNVDTYDEVFEGDGLRYEIQEFLDRIGSDREERPETIAGRSCFMADMMERFLAQRSR